MLNTGAQAALGFIFWIICARLFSPDQIGVAASLISAMSLISYFSLLGFNGTFIRFLPTSKNRNNEINTGLVLVICTAVIIATGYILAVPFIAPKLGIIHQNIFYAVAFVALVALAAINLLTDSIFIAYRAAKYNLLIDGGIQGIIKVVLPFAFVSLGAYGVFIASGSAAMVAMVASIIFLMLKFDYHPRVDIDKGTLRNVFSYSSSSYIANLLNIAPTLILPLLVINRLGAAEAGYYYLAFAVANLLYAIAFSVSQSLFAEGSYGQVPLGTLLKRSLIIIVAIMVPSGIILAFLGPFVLGIFGRSYSVAGAQVIMILALSAPVVAVYSVGNALLRITNKIYSIVVVNVIYFVAVSGFAVLWVDRGLTWIAIAWAIGNLIAGVTAFCLLLYGSREGTNRGKAFTQRWSDLKNDTKVIIASKARSLRARGRNGFKQQTVLCYPDMPQHWHALYQILHELGCRMTNDPDVKYDLAVAFEDTTIRKENTILTQLGTHHAVVNIGCGDITKERVEKIFKDVFGYGTVVDPRTYVGQCVRKSNINGAHDGVIVACPTEPEPAYLYQKVINNTYGNETFADLRVLICRESIVLVYRKVKSAKERFDHTESILMADPNEVFSAEEIEKILRFSKNFGLDYGDLDVLRDADDGKIYIVDANNTPSSFQLGIHMGRKEYGTLVRAASLAFAEAFLTQGA
jgi:O-antigen/teichoic acid export membrane protein